MSYTTTSTYYWGTIQNDMKHVGDGPIIDIEGPFGFGYGAEVDADSKQCMLLGGFANKGDKCAENPVDCEDGFSFSLWEKVYREDMTYSLDEIDVPDDAPKQYLMSTGGDEFGYPGVAIYRKSSLIGALVSTGAEVWQVQVFGGVHPNAWNNVGVRFKKPAVGSKEDGIELFVNLTKIGQTVAAVSVAQEDVKAPHSPSKVMVGCHGTSSGEPYSGYNTGQLDELVLWTKQLPDEDIPYFTGGYEDNYANIDPERLAAILKNVELKDPNQRKSALNMIKNAMEAGALQTTLAAADPTSASEADSTEDGDDSTTSDSDSSPTDSVEGEEEELTAVEQSFDTMVGMVGTMSSLDSVADSMSLEDLMDAAELVDISDSLLNKENTDKWKALQASGEPKSTNMVEGMNSWGLKMLENLEFNNDSEPFHHVKPANNMLMGFKKLSIGDLQKGRNYITVPNYKDKDLLDLYKAWDLPPDRMAVPVHMITDPRCKDRIINIVYSVYDTLGEFAPTYVNPAHLKADREHAIDGRVQHFSWSVDPVLLPDGSIDSSAPPCTPDENAMRKYPMSFKGEHKIKEYAVDRSLTYQESELETDIQVRLCVFWNKKIGDEGAWDSYTCEVKETTDIFTKCACGTVGTFTIMAEKIEPRVIPDEETWLTILRYVGYGISAICLIIYIITVALSGDLKEQFHLMGLNLAVAVLLGSVSMLVTDLNSVRDSRKSCKAMGTLVHYFYLSAGMWIGLLGHASFKAITAGVVGGRLKAYFLMGWGLPMTSLGIAYLRYYDELGTDPRCFISWFDDPKWTFFALQILFIIFAAFYALVVLCNLATPALRKDNLIDDYGSFCRGASILILYFVLTWGFGVVAYIRFDFDDPDFYPIFQVLNSCTGLVLLLFIGFFSRRFRMVLGGQASQRRAMLMGYGGDQHDDTQKLTIPEESRDPSPLPPRSPMMVNQSPRPKTQEIRSRPATRSSSRPQSSESLPGSIALK